jgi:hypothetical protein
MSEDNSGKARQWNPPSVTRYTFVAASYVLEPSKRWVALVPIGGGYFVFVRHPRPQANAAVVGEAR